MNLSRVYQNLSKHITTLKRKLSRPKYLCPICLSPMHDRPVSYNICPTCYTEFDYDDEHRSVAQQWYIKYNVLDGINAGLEKDLQHSADRIRAFEKMIQLGEDRKRRLIYDSEQSVKRHGLKPGELQWKWRNNPPNEFDYGEAESAVIDALCREGIPAWSGDATGCVTQIIEAAYKKLDSCRKAADSFLKYVESGYAMREHQATCFDCSVGLDCRTFLKLLEKEDAALEEAITAAEAYEPSFFSKH